MLLIAVWHLSAADERDENGQEKSTKCKLEQHRIY
jgi:hypothetical protein